MSWWLCTKFGYYYKKLINNIKSLCQAFPMQSNCSFMDTQKGNIIPLLLSFSIYFSNHEKGMPGPLGQGHQATKPPSHQTTRPPGHQVTWPPGHWATGPLGHQPTQPPGHQATGPFLKCIWACVQTWLCHQAIRPPGFSFLVVWAHDSSYVPE